MPEQRIGSTGTCWPNQEQEWLLLAALADGSRAVDAWRAWHLRGRLDAADEGSFRLLPLVYHNLRRLGFDDPVMAVLRGVFRHEWAYNVRLLGALLPQVGRLEAAGTPTLLLKGAALATLYYENVGLRPTRDLDVLVPSGRQAFQIVTHMKAAGWELATWAPREVGPAYWRYRHAVSLQSPQRLHFDVHWHVMFRCRHQAADDGFWERSRPFEIMGVRTRALDATDQLLLACTHGPEFNTIAPLRWIADAMAILRSQAQIDWPRLVEFVLAERLTLPTRDAFELLRRLLDAPIPESVVATLARAPVSAVERAEAVRQLDGDSLQSPLRTFLALLGHYRRSFSGRLTLSETAGFVRHLQYLWRLDSLPAVLPKLGLWIRRRLGGIGTGGRTLATLEPE